MADLKVLGASLPRSGTASMRAALEILGFGPCHHMFAVILDVQQSREWQKIYKAVLAGDQQPDFTKALAGWNSAVDAPASELWPYILKQNPSIKIICTRRDKDQWYKSCESTIFRIVFDTTVYPNLIRLVPRLYQQWVLAQQIRKYWVKTYGEITPEMMDKRVAEVKAGVPSDQLLEYNLGDGWEPLCKFLDVPVPDVPFPRSNDTAAFGEFMDREVKQGLYRWAYLIGGVAIVTGMMARWYRT